MIAEEFSLRGKVAIVTGDGRAWGQHVALALADAGADVAIATLKRNWVEETIERARGLGRKAVAIPSDVTNAVEVQKMVEQVVAGFGKIDILVNGTDLQFAKPFLEVSEKEWRRVIETNLTSVYLCSQAVGRHMVEQKKGAIINIASGLALRGVANCAAYCASMGGVLQFTKALALEWAPLNIRVNSIGPGWFSEDEVGTEEMQKDPLVRFIPMRRRGRPDEIGSLVVYLASDASQYVTGQIFVVDGGTIAHA
jgi:NAD(P)-dependent dehydrogenase (short-subunit alcohol dehydrogenase family)